MRYGPKSLNSTHLLLFGRGLINEVFHRVGTLTSRGVPRIFLREVFKIFLEPFRRLEKVDEGGGGGGEVRVILYHGYRDRQDHSE